MSTNDKESPGAVEQFAAMVNDATKREESPFARAMAEIGNPEVMHDPPPEIIRKWRSSLETESGADSAGADKAPTEWVRLYAARDGLTLTEAAIILNGFNPEEPLFSAQEQQTQRFAVLLEQAVLLRNIHVLNAVDDAGNFVWLSHDHIRRWCIEKGFVWPLPAMAAAVTGQDEESNSANTSQAPTTEKREKSPKAQTTPNGLAHAMAAGLMSYRERHGVDPTARTLFEWLGENDATRIVTGLDETTDKLTWLRADGGLADTGFKAFQTRFTNLMRR